MSGVEREAIAVALNLLAEAMDDGNEHLFPAMSVEQIRALAGSFEA